MAKAVEGGVAAIRANGPEDIANIKAQTEVPVIGILKKVYPDSPVFITPTLAEVAAVAEAGADVVAADMTRRIRPGGQSVEQFVHEIRANFPTLPIMADISSAEDAACAAGLGVDIMATTLVNCLAASKPVDPYKPSFDEIGRIIECANGTPVIVEGSIWDPEDMVTCLEMGAHAVVIGSAITRPHLITRRFVEHLEGR